MNLAPWLPSGLRTHLAPISYCLYLVVLAVLWFVLLGSALLFLSLTFCFVHDEAVRRHLRPERRRLNAEFTAMGLIAAGMLAGALFLPDEIPLVISTVGLGLPALGYLLTTSKSVDLLWRRPRRGGGVRSLRWQSSLALELGTAFLLIAALIMLTRGEFLFGGEGPRLSQQLLITTFLGLVSAWSAAGASLVIGRVVYRSLTIERAFRRARSRPFVVDIHGVRGARRRRLRARFARRGLWVPPRSPFQRRHRPEVRVQVVERLEPDPLRGLDRHAPVEIALAELDEETAVDHVLAAARRRLRVRLLRALKIATRR